jgi:peptidoglycan/xylan/chitin deacetylase (PgdA/CDA1 family)
MTATFFIYPQIIEDHGKNYLTWDEVREMADNGMDIESHTYTHPMMTASQHPEMTPDQYTQFLQHQLLDSKKLIEQHTGKPVRFIAFPYSNIDATVENAAKSYGYDACLYDRNAGELITSGKSPLDLKRFPIEHDIETDQFARDLPPQQEMRSAPSSF